RQSRTLQSRLSSAVDQELATKTALNTSNADELRSGVQRHFKCSISRLGWGCAEPRFYGETSSYRWRSTRAREGSFLNSCERPSSPAQRKRLSARVKPHH